MSKEIEDRGKLIINVKEFFNKNLAPDTIILDAFLGTSYETYSIGMYDMSTIKEEHITGKIVRLDEYGDTNNQPSLDVVGSITLINLRGNRLGIYYDLKPKENVTEAEVENFTSRGIALIIKHIIINVPPFDEDIDLDSGKVSTDGKTYGKSVILYEIKGFTLRNNIPYGLEGLRISNKLGDPELISTPFTTARLTEPVKIVKVM